MKYTYTIQVFTSPQDSDEPAVPHSMVEGEVEADRYSHACRESWPAINAACDQIKKATGLQTSVGDIHVKPMEEQ